MCNQVIDGRVRVDVLVRGLRVLDTCVTETLRCENVILCDSITR